MYCSKCGTEMSNEDRFCKGCGEKNLTVDAGVKILKLKCGSCDATMEYKEKDNITFCPYCGSKNLIIESDKVKVTKIKKDIVVEKQNLEKEKRETKKMDYDHEKYQDQENHKYFVYLVIMVVVMVLFATLI